MDDLGKRLDDLPDDIREQVIKTFNEYLDTHEVIELEPHLVVGGFKTADFACLDCTKGLQGGGEGGALICPRLVGRAYGPFPKATDADVIACGYTGPNRG